MKPVTSPDKAAKTPSQPVIRQSYTLPGEEEKKEGETQEVPKKKPVTMSKTPPTGPRWSARRNA